MKLRTILFWTHLAAGLVAGLVIFIMSVTGTLLTFQQSVLRMVERSQRYVEPPAPDARRLDVDTLLARVRAAVPDAEPTTVTLDADPRVTASVGARTARDGVHQSLHRRRAWDRVRRGRERSTARSRAGTATSRSKVRTGRRRAPSPVRATPRFSCWPSPDCYLWWPRQWTWRHVSAVMLFRGGLRGKARDFNWHNVIGFWCAPVLVVLTASGMVISYTWASNLVYTLSGSPRPVIAGRGGGPGAEGEGGRGGGRGAGRGGRGGELGGGPRTADGDAARGAARNGTGEALAPAPSASDMVRPTLESFVARAERQVPTWRTMIVRLPPRPGGPVAVSMSDREYLEQLRPLDAHA